MPMMRYQIRNEYSLADPELYRAADKDDPEALLEGVAMAGLVGVLRQLGDLAEFAGEIFHNLHEEVMSTAARGHSLMVRVQQLETDVPSIERAFLSQRDHSSFFYNDGIDWRSNLRVDENLVTQGDLPRFVMDSYEECRAPPRLFLLDKFDVAGAGACLKRYTDPSFFKVDISRMSSSDVQREKKILRRKKKGSRWRNGETPETIPASSTKLHELLSVERAESGVSNTSRRVKLKRKLNGFPFDSKTGKSYMEKLLKTSSPDHDLLHEVNENALPSLMLARNIQDGSGLDALEVRTLNTDRDADGRKISLPSPDREEIGMTLSIYDRSEVSADDGISSNGISSSILDKVPSEKVIAVDAESRREHKVTGYESDGLSSDAENFVDAPLTIESDMDTEPKLRINSDFVSPPIRGHQQLSDANKAVITYRSSDSRSTGDSMMSDERKEISSFSCSDSPSTSAEDSHLEKSSKGFPSADNPEIEIGSASSLHKGASEVPMDHYLQPVVSNSTHTRTNSTNSRASDSEQASSRLCRNESISSSSYSDPGVVTKHMLRQPGTALSLDDNDKEPNMVIDVPCHPYVSDSEVNHEDESDNKDANLVDKRASRPNKFKDRSRRTVGSRQFGSSKNLITSTSNDEFSRLHEDFSSVYPDTAHDINNTMPVVSLKENVTYKQDAEENVSATSTKNQTSSESLILPHLEITPDCLQLRHDDSTGEDIIPEHQKTVPENLVIPNHKETRVNSYHMLENFEEPAGESDPLVVDDIILLTSSVGKEVAELCDSVDKKSLNADLVEFGGSHSEGEKSNIIDWASTEQVSKNPVAGDPPLSDGLQELVEEHIHCLENSGLNELDKKNNSLTGLHGKDEGHKGSNVSALPSSLGPNSDSKPHIPSISGITVSEYPDDSCDSNLTPDSTLCEAIQVNLADSPPLPPLPPMQWRTGKLEHTMSSTEVELKKVELLPEFTSLLIASTDDVSTKSRLTCGDVGSSHEASQLSSVETVTKAAPENEGGENSCSNLESEDDCETSDLPLNIESKPLLVMPNRESEPSPLVDEDGVLPHSSTEEVPHPHHPLVEDVTALDKSEQQEVTDQDRPQLQAIDERDLLLEPMRRNDVHEEIDLSPKIEGKQEQFVMPTVESESISQSEDGVAYGRHAEKLTQPGAAPVEDTTLDEKPTQPGTALVEDVKLDESLMEELTQSDTTVVEDAARDENHMEKLAQPGAALIEDATLDETVMEKLSPPGAALIEDATLDETVMEKLSPPGAALIEDATLDETVMEKLSPPGAALVDDVTHDESCMANLAQPGAAIVEDASCDKIHMEEVAQPSAALVEDATRHENHTEKLALPATHVEDATQDESHTEKLAQPGVALVEDATFDEVHIKELAQPGATLVEDSTLDDSQPKNVPNEGASQVEEEQTRSGDKKITLDHPPLTNSTQLQLVMLTPENEYMPPAEDVAIESHAEKLPHTSNPSIKDAAAIDKIHEVAAKETQLLNRDENPISEQIRTNGTPESTDLTPKMEEKQHGVMPTPASESMPESEENEAANVSRRVKQLLPHNPLVEDKSVLDKSKLRKVGDRVIPEVPKLDDQNSFLEQIRTKSFNLKRTTTSSRPSILNRAPAANLNVAAILEKANAMRQAIAGSDEDDDDSWSDS
ncbi:protein SCAR4-like isoform X2 [Andrographis paniculata]|uniref:protein SCAR4-like isoform X2 n=1 Tax=Andrographis paniculata TaxID=175694 RepID=UPI0021E74F1F|nr:protein SCAR4-like isoform X2 [Andrographis paniculata]